MKYINFEVIGIVIFGDHIKHSTMQQIVGRKALSAGRFSADPEYAHCSGDSESLGVASTPADTSWIKHFINY